MMEWNWLNLARRCSGFGFVCHLELHLHLHNRKLDIILSFRRQPFFPPCYDLERLQDFDFFPPLNVPPRFSTFESQIQLSACIHDQIIKEFLDGSSMSLEEKSIKFTKLRPK
jgi:hypothetical protein